VDGRRVFYRTLPAGPAAGGCPPLLLIHGISCCTETWAPFVDALAERSDAPGVIVPDLPAHGRSARPDRILGMGDFAGWTERLLRRLEVGRVDVMGHSMGCQVALALARARPERVRRAVLLGPTTGGRHVSTLRNFFGLMADSTREPLSYNLLLLRVFLRMGARRYLLTVREMQRDDAFLHAREIMATTLVLQGDRDLIVPRHVGQDLARVLRRSAYARVAGAAHAAQFTHPKKAADATLAFLAASAGRRPLAPPERARRRASSAGSC
jgi:pimeloyl-ACP methyl ester carboxylesterase